MTVIEQFQREFESEVLTTRKMLSIVPQDKFEWQPHPKSMTLKRLATHVAELPSWIGMTLTTSELDFENNAYEPQVISSTADLLAYFEQNVLDGREYLKNAKEEQLSEIWTLRSGATVYSSDPKVDVLRMSFSQTIHHRAQLGVFLRLLDIPIPGSYGPSADDMSF
ncbi:DinB family protein [Flectobacillus major]|jgi:uncharacterized damage-inducible protein DinB|uniref:DinB family protein n=1 Tax=Flectobacillus major TaxID=103 RepID=UPI000413E18F|nr:DinB family protein [Flectobacillus major]